MPCSLCGVQPLFKELPIPNRYWGRVKLVFHPPIHPQAFLGKGPRRVAKVAMTNAIRDAIASAIDYPAATEIEEHA